MTPCDELRPLLDLAPLGLLDPREQSLHDAHLASCQPCRRDAAALTALHATDRAFVERGVLPMPMPARLEETLVGEKTTTRSEEEPEKKKTVMPGPAVDPARVEAVGRLISLSCSFCHGRTTRDEIVFCASCVAPHHAECFATHGRCALPGCEETSTVRPHAGVPQPRRSGRLLALALVACTGVGAAAWSALRPDPLSPATLLAQAHTHKRELQQAVREGDAAGAQAALTKLEAACANAEAGDPTFADRTRALRQDARRSRRALDEQRISIEAHAEEIEKVAERIGQAAGRNILVAPYVQETVTITLRDLRWTEILRAVADMTRCQIRELPGGVLVLDQPPKVTIQFTDANIRTVLQLLAAYSGKNVVIEEDVRGTVTVDLKEVPWDEALLTLARAKDLHVTLWGEIVLVSTSPRQGQPLVLDVDQEWAADALTEIDDSALIDVIVRDATIPAVCGSIARQSGRRVEALGCDDVRVTLDLRQVPWRGAVDAVAAMARLDVEVREGGEVLFAPTASNLLIAEGVRVAIWAQLLATVAGVKVEVPFEAFGAVVTTRLGNTDPLKALDVLARQLGWTLRHVEGDAYELVCPTGWRSTRSPTTPTTLTLQATIMTSEGNWAIISDRVHAEGHPLLGDDQQPIPGSGLLTVMEGTARVRVGPDDTRTLSLPAR